MYKHAWQEYFSGEIVETEQGFALYKFVPEYESMYLSHVYLKPESRSGLAYNQLMKQVEAVGRDAGMKTLTAHVQMSYHGRDRSLAAGLRYGFKMVAASSDSITIAKEL